MRRPFDISQTVNLILKIHKNEAFRKLLVHFLSQILILGHFWELSVHFWVQLYQNLNLDLIF